MTDQYALTDNERDLLRPALYRFAQWQETSEVVMEVVARIVAARVAQVTADRDRLAE